MKKYLVNLILIVTVCFSASAQNTDDEIIITGNYIIPNAPEWVHDAVFYQIYPQTYYDTDGDGIGDLNGIIEKLDYVKSLGVDAIWLNPFFESPFMDAGYDISDYYKVAPRYGTNADAKRLFDEAHKRGLKVIFDYVVSYTSIEHPWFKESAKQDTNKYSNWYIWNDNTWKNAPDAYKDAFIKGYSRRNGQFMRNFYWCQPALNFGFAKPEEPWMLPTDHPDILALRAELKKVLRFWMDMGADGFRADMAGALVKNANISGNDQFFNSKDQATKEFWQEIRQIFVEEYPDAFMVAEWSGPQDALDNAFHADFFHWFAGYNDLTQKESWRILNGYSEGHSFFDSAGLGNIVNFVDSYMEQYIPTRDKGYIVIPLGNHDNARININRTPKELELIYAFAMTMPGIPFMYYGNEIGMKQLYGLPYVEGAYKPRAGNRTPMQWTPGKNLGFSTGEPENLYLPVDSDENAPNVEIEENNPNSLLNKTRKLIELRHNEKALWGYSEFIPVYAKENTYPFVYARAADDEVILCIFNPANRTENASFSINKKAKKLELLAGDKIKFSNKGNDYSIEVPPISYAVYKLK
ncbi:MAG: alpha-amylase [Bacteroidales bacterium]|nr:alpha-amylase [Bacteroidales bacterium]MBN2819489.1 alpha-amylase [Bacteroidales bacterium]